MPFSRWNECEAAFSHLYNDINQVYIYLAHAGPLHYIFIKMIQAALPLEKRKSLDGQIKN